MAKVKRVEKQIWDIEQFAVRICHLDGRDVRDDKQGLPTYDYERCAKDTMTVAYWKETRFASKYPGFEVEVLDGDGYVANGNTLLSTLRDSYMEDSSR